jgi:uncharacterized protein YdaU (DUF1376 family)
MTMHYMPLYMGDYLRDTRHLSPMMYVTFNVTEQGSSLLLLMYCWDNQGSGGGVQ